MDVKCRVLTWTTSLCIRIFSVPQGVYSYFRKYFDSPRSDEKAKNHTELLFPLYIFVYLSCTYQTLENYFFLFCNFFSFFCFLICSKWEKQWTQKWVYSKIYAKTSLYWYMLLKPMGKEQKYVKKYFLNPTYSCMKC